MTSKTTTRPRLFTLGHSDRALEEFLTTLEKSSIRLVADIRSNPASVRFPHFERSALSKALEDRGLVYRWFRQLGGRKAEWGNEEEHSALADEGLKRYASFMNSPVCRTVVQDLIGLSASTVMVLLCAERDPHNCHRILLSDLVHVLGGKVVHIIDKDTAFEHSLHPDLVVRGDQICYERKQFELL